MGDVVDFPKEEQHTPVAARLHVEIGVHEGERYLCMTWVGADDTIVGEFAVPVELMPTAVDMILRPLGIRSTWSPKTREVAGLS
jgi:hypothetical protein